MSIRAKMNYLKETKRQMINSLNNKNRKVTSTTPFREFSKEIDKLEESVLNPEWYDVYEIIKNDTEDYPSKMIVLLGAYYDNIFFVKNNDIAKIVTSDDAEYVMSDYSDAIEHVWDKTKDQNNDYHSNTRYFIFYFNTKAPTVDGRNTYIAGTTVNNTNNNYFYHIVLKDCDITFLSATNFIRYSQIRKIDSINSTLTANSLFMLNGNITKIPPIKLLNPSIHYSLYNAPCLKELELIADFDSFTGLASVFSNLSSLEKLILPASTKNVTNMQSIFSNDSLNYSTSQLKYINALDFDSCTVINGAFNGLISLQEIGEVYNIKISGLNVSSCTSLNYDTLIRILNALYDYSDSEETHTLILGQKNIEKLGEAISIATNKGWTVL